MASPNRSLLCWKVNLYHRLGCIWSGAGISCKTFGYLTVFILPSILTGLPCSCSSNAPLERDAATTMLHHRNVVRSITVLYVRQMYNMEYGIQLLSHHTRESLRVLFYKLQLGCHACIAALPAGLWLIEGYWEGCFYKRSCHLCREHLTLSFWVLDCVRLKMGSCLLSYSARPEGELQEECWWFQLSSISQLLRPVCSWEPTKL